MKSDTCGVCKVLNGNGFFDSVKRDIDVFDVVIMDLGKGSRVASDHPSHEILNIDPYFPSFKYMTENTFDRIEEGTISTTEALGKMFLLNGKIVNGVYATTSDYKDINMAAIQDFCDTSAEKLASLRASPGITGPSPKYRSKYQIM